MSEIFTSLRLLESEQHELPADAKPKHASMAASVVRASDFAALKVLTVPRFQDDEEPEFQDISVPNCAVLPEPPPFESVVNENDLAALEDRVVQAVEMVKQERQCRLAAEESISRLEAEKAEQAPRIESLERELRVLRNERNSGRQRVERMLVVLDSLSF